MNNNALNLEEYQRLAAQTDQNSIRGRNGLELPMLGLFGETGSLLSELKKKQRDKDSYFAYKESVIEEFGDILWYLSNIASRMNLSLVQLATVKNSNRKVKTFGDLQRGINRSADNRVFPNGLLDLATVVGKVSSYLTQGNLDRKRASSDLADVLVCLVIAASEAGVDLSEAARRNLSKVSSRWPRHRNFTPLFDENSLPEERLPRQMEIILAEKAFKGRVFVMQQCKGINIGDRLTDNRSEPDDYRFHDVFHLAYAAILGWSPVTRALFKLKRKSEPQKDENEDGARAILLEECISTWVFNNGGRFNFYQSINNVGYDLLKSINHFVKGYEVEKCPLWMWEHAILEGYKVFRFMKKHRAGIVSLDLSKRTIDVRRAPR